MSMQHSGSRFRTSWAAVSLALAAAAGCGKEAAGPPAPPPPAPALRFEDRAAEGGLDYEWRVSGKRPLNILQTIGNGCGFLDYDGDGALDVLLVGTPTRLYRGDGRGGFADVTRTAGLADLGGRLLGCAVGDYDNDGRPDVYLSGYRTGTLLRNEGGRFRDVTREAGLAPQPWGTSCSFTDVDADGHLDLIIANYAHFGPEPGIPQLCTSHGVPTSCGPRYYRPLKPVLYRNQGRGRFADVSGTAGMTLANGRGLGVAALAIGEGRRPVIAFANDELPGDLLMPSASGALSYRNTASLAGTAVDRQGNIHGGMGADFGDFDGDGRFDLFVTTFENEPKSLYRDAGGGSFNDVSSQAGLDRPALRLVSFGCKLLDGDNDGRLDLMIASGHVQDNIEKIDSSSTYRQRSLLLRNPGGAVGAVPRFEDVSAGAGPFFQRSIVGRGLSTGDYDNDGRLDALIVDSEGKPALLHNETPGAGHWLALKLVGKASNRDGIGAIIEIRAGDRRLLRHCHTDGSYLSASDRRVHFGLGSSTIVEALTIRWPSGTLDTYRDVAADRVMTAREGESGR